MKSCIKAILLLSLLSSDFILSLVKGNNSEEFKENFQFVLTQIASLGENGIQFLKVVNNLTQENSLRYSNIRDAISELATDFEQANITTHETKIVKALHTASDTFSKMNRILIETCSHNELVYKNLMRLPKLDRSSITFHEDAAWVLGSQAKLLKGMADYTKIKMEVANNYVNGVDSELTNVSDILAHASRSLKIIGDKKRAGLSIDLTRKEHDIKYACKAQLVFCWWTDDEALDAAEKSKAGLLIMIEKTEKFLNESNRYVKWIEDNSFSLKALANAHSAIVSRLKGFGDGQSLAFGDLEQRNLTRLKEIEINYFYDSFRETAGDIYNVCPAKSLKFNVPGIDKNGVAGGRLHEKNKLYDCAFENTDQSISTYIYNDIYSSIQSSPPLLVDETLDKVVSVSTFFDVSLDKLGSIFAHVKTNVERFLNRHKSIVATVATLTIGKYEVENYPELMAQLTRFYSGWTENLSMLQTLKLNWDLFMSRIKGDTTNFIIESVLSNEIEKKIKSIIEVIDNLELGMVEKISYRHNKTADFTTFAWDTLVYTSQILQVNLTDSVDLKTESISLLVNNKVLRSEDESVGTSSCLIVQDDRHYVNLIMSKYHEIKTSFSFLTNVTTKNKVFAMSVFFDIALESIIEFGSILKMSINKFLVELKIIYTSVKVLTQEDTGDKLFYDMQIHMEQLSLLWGNKMSNLRLQRDQWHIFLSAIGKIKKSGIEHEVESKITEVVKSLNTRVDRRKSYIYGKTVLWDIVTYLQETL